MAKCEKCGKKIKFLELRHIIYPSFERYDICEKCYKKIMLMNLKIWLKSKHVNDQLFTMGFSMILDKVARTKNKPEFAEYYHEMNKSIVDLFNKYGKDFDAMIFCLANELANAVQAHSKMNFVIEHYNKIVDIDKLLESYEKQFFSEDNTSKDSPLFNP